jgi:hypothetical protein
MMGKLGQLNNIVVRRYVKETDLAQVEALERSCEVGLGASLFADMLGDPLCRVRHLPVHTMLVAEVAKQIVGVVRGGVNDVVCRSKKITGVSEEDASSLTIVPVYARVGYLLGLRVCPLHRYLLILSSLSKPELRIPKTPVLVDRSLITRGFRSFVVLQEDGNCNEASGEDGGMVRRTTSGVRVYSNGERQCRVSEALH